MKNRVFLLEQLFKKYDEICEKRMQNILQIFLDFIDENKDLLNEYISKDYSSDFIGGDFIFSLEYDINNILDIAKECETTDLFKEFKNELIKIKE